MKLETRLTKVEKKLDSVLDALSSFGSPDEILINALKEALQDDKKIEKLNNIITLIWILVVVTVILNTTILLLMWGLAK